MFSLKKNSDYVSILESKDLRELLCLGKFEVRGTIDLITPCFQGYVEF